MPSLLPYAAPDYVYIDRLELAEYHLAHIEDGATVGFDIEADHRGLGPRRSRTAKKELLQQQIQSLGTFVIDWNRVSICVVQIATTSEVFVIHLRRMQALPKQLVRICTSNQIVKVGVGIYGDGQRLWDSFRINLNRALSLGHYARLVYPDSLQTGCPFGTEAGLAAIVEITLGKSLSKELQTSNWGATILSSQQLAYAAIDSHATMSAYMTLQKTVARANLIVDEDWYTCNSSSTEVELGVARRSHGYHGALGGPRMAHFAVSLPSRLLASVASVL
ncbi:Ribonuclease H-like protein [Mycena indigotica]|uniref:3'-5' exonuclease n=1 Tax=Mycena indigotica TaxID=2126181 RepID=A0A8H6S8V9_9AGAR|nr:Ribonuclease H-like protein [Mycena indigotica]KAF7293425.1 Ribonuclease H-like protein [Mycena indigotica]